VSVAFRPTPTTSNGGLEGINPVGQPILAAAGFQPALSEFERFAREPPERRLQAGLPAPLAMLRNEVENCLRRRIVFLPHVDDLADMILPGT